MDSESSWLLRTTQLDLKNQKKMIVEIKQHPDNGAYSIGLEKYGRSKLPGTFETVQPLKGIDNRWITGVDEKSLAIAQMRDPVAREARSKEVLEIRQDIEQRTGLDLDATNDKFWEVYKVTLKDNFSLDFANPLDKLKYYVLTSNAYAAPEIGVLNNPDYINTKYYVSRKEEEARVRVVSRKIKDQAKAELLKLSENYDKLVLIAKYVLGTRRIKQGMNAEIIYDELSNYLEDAKEKANISNFLEAINKTVEELQYKLTIDEAMRMGLIKVREGYYQRGNATYGKSLAEAIKYLSSSENAYEFDSLRSEVDAG